MTVGCYEFGADLLGKGNVEGIVECQFMVARQTDGPFGQVVGSGEKIHLEVIDRLNGAQDVIFGKARIMKQGVRDLIDEQIGSDQRSVSGNMGVAEHDSRWRIRLVHEPFQGDRGVDNGHLLTRFAEFPENLDAVPAGSGFSTQPIHRLGRFRHFRPVVNFSLNEKFHRFCHGEPSIPDLPGASNVGINAVKEPQVRIE